MTAPEFSRTVRIDALGTAPRQMELTADAAERAALARRFGLAALDRLQARLAIWRAEAGVTAAGTISAALAQPCVVTGEPVPARIEAPFDLLFRPQPEAGREEEIELGESELDVIFHDGAMIDVGEAVAQTLALALDPYPRAPGAAEALKAAGVKSEGEAGPFGALAGLKDRLAEK